MVTLAPRVNTLHVYAAPVSTVGNDASSVIKSPFAGTVTGVAYLPAAARAGADTNSRTLNLINKGSNGSGTTVVATLALVAGVDLAAFDEKALTLSVVAGATTVAEGDVLHWQSLHVGTGIADPGGTALVTVSRTA